MIELDNVEKFYGRSHVLRGLTFTAAPGRVTAFVGKNGSGKTTTLRILCGLESNFEGAVRIRGEDVRSGHSTARSVGAVLDPGCLHPGRTGRETLLLKCLQYGIPHSEAGRILERVGLPNSAARKRVGSYSLGMRQRLAIGYALLGDPPVLVFDEPANGLDPGGMRWLRDELRHSAASGKSILVSSHHLAEVEQMADDVVVLRDGVAVHQGAIGQGALAARTLVSSSDNGMLEKILHAAAVSFERTSDGLLAEATATDVGRLAQQNHLALRLLQGQSSSVIESLVLGED